MPLSQLHLPSFSFAMSSADGSATLHDFHPAAHREMQLRLPMIQTANPSGFDFLMRTVDTRFEGHIVYKCDYTTRYPGDAEDNDSGTIFEERRPIPSCFEPCLQGFWVFMYKVKNLARAVVARRNT